MFEEFPKLARLSRECVITEKIDGTNAQVYIVEAMDGADAVYFTGPQCDGCGDVFNDPERDCPLPAGGTPLVDCGRGGHMFNQPGLAVYAGSRNRWITPAADNFGFAKWVRENARELLSLGPGRHFGEWWGSGIQRGYGLTNGEKRFSLFNSARWGAAYEARKAGHENTFPACCHVVPVLSRGEFTTANVEAALFALQTAGSQASPGFMNPEGVVVWHEAARVMFKKTLGGDGHKGAEKSARREAQINA